MTDYVFVLQHVASEGELDQDVKFIGVFSSKARAEKEIDKLVKQPGFSKYPEGFYIDQYIIDEGYWSEGFVAHIKVIDQGGK